MEDIALNYLIDVASTTVNTYLVTANSPEEAQDRYSDGIVVNSEATGPQIQGVSLA